MGGNNKSYCERADRRQTTEKPPKNLYKIEEEAAAAGRSMLVAVESKRIRRTMESFKKVVVGVDEWREGD